MITTKRQGYLQVYLQTLCPPEVMDNFLLQLQAMDIQPEYEVRHQDFREYEFSYRDTRMIIQYDAFVGICLYAESLERATEAEEEKLLRLAHLLLGA